MSQGNKAGRAKDMLLLAAFFIFCSGSGLLWGLAVKAPGYPALPGIPLSPHAQQVVDRSTRIPGLASPTPSLDLEIHTGLVNFQYKTRETPAALLAFYHTQLEKQYGFQLYREDGNSQDQTVLHFVRQRSQYTRQLVDITVTASRDGYTQVEGVLTVLP
ncbi:MAG: hypothetical protein M3014_02430 [Chloroflexota bacterium]|nr:hypothetical protein [Chloroflexota bacterium]